MRQSSSNSMEGKFIKCSECESKNCTHCEKIVLKVVGTSDSAKELYNTVLAALDKVDVDASVVLSPDNSEYKHAEDRVYRACNRKTVRKDRTCKDTVYRGNKVK